MVNTCMRCEYKAAFIGGIPLGIGILCVSLMASPNKQWELLFLLLSGCIGALLAYSCYRSCAVSFSLTKGAVVGASVGIAAGIIHYTCAAIIYLAVANSEVVLNTHSMSLAVIGVVQLTVASGVGGLVAALVSKVGRRSSTNHND